MDKLEVIKIPFYKFKIADSIREEVSQIVQNLYYEPERIPENGYKFDNFFHEELYNFFESSIREVQKIYYNDDLTFPIVDCWVNKYAGLNNLRRHAHSNAVICGLYYVTDHSNSTIFEAKNVWNTVTISNDISLLNITKTSNPLNGEVVAEAGTLVLFPPSLYHYMKPIKIKSEIRYTIAFNAFPSGLISNNSTNALNIKTISLRERLGKL